MKASEQWLQFIILYILHILTNWQNCECKYIRYHIHKRRVMGRVLIPDMVLWFDRSTTKIYWINKFINLERLLLQLLYDDDDELMMMMMMRIRKIYMNKWTFQMDRMDLKLIEIWNNQFLYCFRNSYEIIIYIFKPNVCVVCFYLLSD